MGEIAVAMTGSDHGSKAGALENEKLIHDLEEIIAKLRQ